MPPKRSNPRAKFVTHREGRPGKKAGRSLTSEEKKRLRKIEKYRALLADLLPPKKRLDRDAYLTDPDYCLAICRRLARVMPAPRRMVEPSAGTGNFIRAAKVVWPEVLVMAVDLHPKHHRDLVQAGAASYLIGDWLAQDTTGFNPDLDLGNPPYSLAEAHVAHAMKMLRPGAWLAFLLPVSFVASQRRARSLYANPEPDANDPATWAREEAWGGLRYVMPLAERPSYTGDGHTDMTEYAVYVWQKGFVGFPTMLPHCWKADRLCVPVPPANPERLNALRDPEPLTDGEEQPSQFEAAVEVAVEVTP